MKLIKLRNEVHALTKREDHFNSGMMTFTVLYIHRSSEATLIFIETSKPILTYLPNNHLQNISRH